jgi:hypothetical protein
MNETRDLLERVGERFAFPDEAFERMLRRRDRKRRNQRIAAGVVGIAVFLAAVWIVTTGGPFDRSQPAVPAPDERVGFIGLAPVGSTPSTPQRGELVLSLSGRSTTRRAPGIGEGPLFRAWVYADGRLIWDEEGDLPYGANEVTTGFLEQRLTPEGVELLRSELIATGLFDTDHALLSEQGVIWGTVEVRTGDGLVSVDWSNPDIYPVGRDPLLHDATVATAEQASALERLDALLARPEPWLPSSAWADREIRAYIPSTYAVCYGAAHGGIAASRVLNVLPEPAQDLLRDNRTRDPYCSEVTTDEARALAQIFDDAAFGQDELESSYRLNYHFEPSVALAPGPIENTVDIFFEPYLPHGEFLECSPCR